MAGIDCLECGAKLKVVIKGGEFFVRDGSTLDNINFEHAVEEVPADPDTVSLSDEGEEEKQQLDNDPGLTIEVFCSEDPTHGIFEHVESQVKREIYGRLKHAAAGLERKHHSA